MSSFHKLRNLPLRTQPPSPRFFSHPFPTTTSSSSSSLGQIFTLTSPSPTPTQLHVHSTTPYHPCYRTLHTTTTTPPHSSPSQPPDTPVLPLTSFNIEKELLRSPTPTVLLLYAESSPECLLYFKELKQAIHTLRENSSREAPLRLATINCEREGQLARQFGADRLGVPMTFFVYKGQVVDRAPGVMKERQIGEALRGFQRVLREQYGWVVGREGSGGSAERGKTEKENGPLGVVAEAKRCGEVEEAMKACKKVFEMCEGPIEELKKGLGVGVKKISQDITNKMKENEHMQATAQAHALLCRLYGQKGEKEKAAEHAKVLRSELSWALKDDREIAQTIADFEIRSIVEFDPDKHSVAYLKGLPADSAKDPDEYYLTHLRLSVAFYTCGQMQEAIDELLSLIRLEPRLHKAPKSRQESTPARRMILLLFEMEGAESEIVQKARRKLSALLFC